MLSPARPNGPMFAPPPLPASRGGSAWATPGLRLAPRLPSPSMAARGFGSERAFRIGASFRRRLTGAGLSADAGTSHERSGYRSGDAQAERQRMYAIENLKRTVRRLTPSAKPTRQALRRVRRHRRADPGRFDDDGAIPNNRLPFVVYRSPIRLAGAADPAAVIEDLFEANGWRDSWRNGIYDYVHYHSRIHEVLGIARGTGKVQFGGPRGRTFTLRAGDVAILPAGTGHQCLGASKDFLVVGAYPPFGTYDECRTSRAEHERATKTIPKVAPPKKDPVYGRAGALPHLWGAGSKPG